MTCIEYEFAGCKKFTWLVVLSLSLSFIYEGII